MNNGLNSQPNKAVQDTGIPTGISGRIVTKPSSMPGYSHTGHSQRNPMTKKIIIGSFGPSAQQIGEAARTLALSPKCEVIVRNRPNPGGVVFGDQPYDGRRQKDYERGLSYLHDLAGRRTLVNQVFLGGSCNPTTWRQDIAIPALEAAGVGYYNPQVADWSPDLMALEATAKTTSLVLLFVFDAQTRAIATLNEAYEFIGDGKQQVVLVLSYLKAGLNIEGQIINTAEAEDINQARAELHDFARAQGVVPIFTAVPSAVDRCIRFCQYADQDVNIPDVRIPNIG